MARMKPMREDEEESKEHSARFGKKKKGRLALKKKKKGRKAKRGM